MVEALHEGAARNRKMALTLENALHGLFKNHRFRPPAPLLSGGNSECFIFDADVEKKVRH
jgi:hypothetical protein